MPRFVEDEGKKKKERVRRRKSKRRKKRKGECPSTTSKATVSPTVNKTESKQTERAGRSGRGKDAHEQFKTEENQ